MVSTAPALTVAICTRDRGAAVLRPVAAVLDGTFDALQVIVIDQSDDHTTREALATRPDDPRLLYVSSATRGLTHARNIALALNTSPLLAFTDDDCEPTPTWAEECVAFGRTQHEPFIAFGPFIADLASAHAGMIPAWKSSRPGPRRRTALQRCVGGFGGNMLLNAAAIGLVGPFNAAFGRGHRYSAAEEGDYAFRLALAGGTVWELQSPAVTHYGVVPHSRVSQALRDDYRATGVMLAWQLKAGRASALSQLVFSFWREVSLINTNIVRARLPLGLRRPWWLLRGFAHGLRTSRSLPSPLPVPVEAAMRMGAAHRDVRQPAVAAAAQERV